MAAKLGDFFLDIKTNTDVRPVKQLRSELKMTNQVALGLTATLAGMATGFLMITKRTAEETAELNRLSKDIGVNISRLDEFQRMFQLAGGTSAQATETIKKLNDTIVGFRFGIGKFEELGKFLGISPKDFIGDFEKDFDLLRSRLATKTPKERRFFTEQLDLGESIRLLRLSDTEFSNIKSQANETQLVTSKMADDSEKFAQNMAKISISFTDLKRQLTGSTLTEFNNLTDTISSLFKDKDFLAGLHSTLRLSISFLNVLLKTLSFFVSAIPKANRFTDGLIGGAIGSVFKAATTYETGRIARTTGVDITQPFVSNVTVNAATTSSAEEIATEVDSILKDTFRLEIEKQKTGVVS